MKMNETHKIETAALAVLHVLRLAITTILVPAASAHAIKIDGKVGDKSWKKQD